MNAVSEWVFLTLAIGFGLVVGALAALSWQGRAPRKKKRTPLYWPINNRRVANSEELKVWNWLIKTFPEHHILVKIPITRFTIPQDKHKGLELYKMLNALYCSFTVCSADGKIVGCVDIPVVGHISKKNIQLKEKILFQCQIGYWVLNSGLLPEPNAIRSKFLGEVSDVPSATGAAEQGKPVADASQKLHAFTETVKAGRAGLIRINGEDFWSELNQQNSFLTPVDSRRAELVSEK